MRLQDEGANHMFRHVEVGNDPILQGADGHDAAWGPSQHLLGLLAHLQHLIRAFLDGDNRWLAQDDSLALDIDQGVGGSQVDGEIIGEHPEEPIKKHARSFPARPMGRTVVSPPEHTV
jgi:hypothetical protein